MSAAVLHTYRGENIHSSLFLTPSYYTCSKIWVFFYWLEKSQALRTVPAVSNILTLLLVSKYMLILNIQILCSCSCLSLMESLVIYAAVRPAAGLCLLTLVSCSFASCISFLIRGAGKGILTLLKFHPHMLTAIFAVRMRNGRCCFCKCFLFVVLLCELYIEFLDDSARG